MDDYYVYVHISLRTGAVFYVGKGRGNRAYSTAKRSNKWKNFVKENGYKVRFIRANLSHSEALKEEEKLILEMREKFDILNVSTKSRIKELNSEFLRQLFVYDDTSPSGLRWNCRPRASVKVGDVAGHLQKGRYWVVVYKKVPYLAHRIVWALHYGSCPVDLVIDHIDNNKANNLITNLQTLSLGDNSSKSSKRYRQTLHCKNTSGYNRIMKRVRGNCIEYVVNWVDSVTSKTKRKCFNVKKFNTEEEALQAAIKFEESLMYKIERSLNNT